MIFRKRSRSRAQPVTTVIIIAVLAVVWGRERYQQWKLESGDPAVVSARCVNVIDGDTYDVTTGGGRRDRVRVLGIDCPETHNEEKRARQARSLGLTEGTLLELGEEATREARRRLLRETVHLVFPPGTDRRDDYDRLLGYVEVDGEDFGEELLRQGLAETRRERHQRSGRYEEAAREARREGRTGRSVAPNCIRRWLRLKIGATAASGQAVKGRGFPR